MNELFDLFFTFFKIGAFTFGGGYAMLPMIEKEIVDNKGWATKEEVIDYFAIGQCTPGVIAVNTATFIGYKNKGIIGAVLATLGVITPSIIIISIIALFLQQFSHLQWTKYAFAGIRVAVLALMIEAIIKMWKSSVKDKFGLLIYVLILGIMLVFDISPVIMVVVSALMGIFYKRWKHE